MWARLVWTNLACGGWVGCTGSGTGDFLAPGICPAVNEACSEVSRLPGGRGTGALPTRLMELGGEPGGKQGHG